MGHIRSRGRGDSVMAIAAVIALTIGMSIAGLYLGGHAAMVLRATLRQSIPGGSLIRLIIPLGVVLGWTSWLAALLLSIFLAPSSQNYWRSSVCGCLTTVSTFVVEITSLSRRRDGYVYAGGSIMVALAVMVIVAGSLRWTRGWEDASCST